MGSGERWKKSKCEESHVKIKCVCVEGEQLGRECSGFLGIVSNVSYFANRRILFLGCKLFEIHSLYIPTSSKIELLLLPQMFIWKTFLWMYDLFLLICLISVCVEYKKRLLSCLSGMGICSTWSSYKNTHWSSSKWFECLCFQLIWRSGVPMCQYMYPMTHLLL